MYSILVHIYLEAILIGHVWKNTSLVLCLSFPYLSKKTYQAKNQ